MHSAALALLVVTTTSGIPPRLEAPPTVDGVAPVVVDARDLAPDARPQTLVRSTLRARFEPETRTVTGTHTLSWESPAKVALDALPIHLYLNAFANEGSSWARQMMEIRGWDVDELLDAHDDPWGHITITQVTRARVDETGATTKTPATHRFVQPNDDNPLDRTLAVVDLVPPLAPGETLTLTIEFTSRLPIPIARTGGLDTYFHVAQWYPKPAVYEVQGERGNLTGGFAGRQFHGPTEFYADFADVDVTLDVPADWTLLATGEGEKLQTDLPTRQRVRFTERAVHDFAFVVAREVHTETHEKVPQGGGPPVRITYLVPSGLEHTVAGMRHAAEVTFDVLGARVGPYPYSTMKIVAPPWKALATSGMEYPTLVAGSPADPFFERPFLVGLKESDATIAHEVTHNYFYGLVANDEQSDAFLDEGFTQYWEMEIMRTLAEGGPLYGHLLDHPVDPLRMMRAGMKKKRELFVEPVVKQPAYLYRSGTHGNQIYTRTALIFTTAARLFGQAEVDRVFREWFLRKRFSHPSTGELFTLIDEVAPKDLAAFLREAYATAALPDYAVDEATSEEWSAPRGHFTKDGAPLVVTSQNVDDEASVQATLDARAREEDGRVLLHVVDPGTTSGVDATPGYEERRFVTPAKQAARASFEREDGAFFRSFVRVRAPGWDTIPVDVRFTFADGVVITERITGRAPWREFRFVRAAPLDEVVIDPDDTLLIDVDPQNNARALHVDEPRSGLFAALTSGLAALVALTVSLWL